jgi:rhamnosyltransferase
LRRDVSVVVRTYNEGEHVGTLLKSLRGQAEYGPHLDIVVVDSGSTDGTLGILGEYGITPISICRESFNYASSLNTGIEASRGELVVVLSGHAVPCNRDWILRMVSSFEQDDVAGVYCRQRPWPGADIHEVVRLDRAFDDASKQFRAGGDLGPMHFSNAASCIRRSVWEEHRFAIMPAAEDREWAAWAVEHGYAIVYEAAARVYHSHTESCRKAAWRVIELEKAADLARPRKRTAMLTARQSLGLLVRDVKDISNAPAENCRKLVSLSRTVRKCFWYAVDFGRL